MAIPITLKLQNRSPNTPIKSLPSSIEITTSTTVEDAKHIIAKQIHFTDPNRIGLFPVDGKPSLKDRKALLTQQTDIMSADAIAVRDLGPQISWRTVFIVEYAGPLLIHILALLVRPYLYPHSSNGSQLSSTQSLAMILVVSHYLKRELEIAFVHKFSATTMPFFNLFKNSFHYWVIGGLNLAYWIYSPTATIAHPPSRIGHLLTYLGVALYLYGEISNLLVHIKLSKLRSTGGAERGIPLGYGFNWVTCPNYFFETLAWVGVVLVTKSWATAIFTLFSFAQMWIWAVSKEKRYRAEFGDEYKKHRYTIIPGIV
ncbi:hypothetical protein MFRU_003g04400 [Monilinia fructicola]|uniref:very-long-chain enoyl-CoA reductase n=1 Tax=Monilinia fructicola TaxID=38448 RepID=A0A5M9JUN9_MONFR|nr:hypothetical protein EYC84_002954 [Monilinia fructicola]KAG4034479.1 hypothetical protein MFRU_003g04400 [Monilinia fructicola]